MLKKLRLKIIVATTLTLALMFVSVFAALNVFMRADSLRQTETLLTRIIGMDGMPPRIFFRTQAGDSAAARLEGGQTVQLPPPEAEIIRARRFFYVKLDAAGRVLELRRDMMFDFTDEEAMRFVAQAQARRAEKGRVGAFQFMTAQKPYGSIWVFCQRGIEDNMLSRLIRVSLWAAGGTGLALFVFSVFFARWAVEPVKTAFERQRRFISDASHELKTPLTILSANADLLSRETDSRYLENIRQQAGRMGRLIHDLLTLTRADERAPACGFADFDLSRTVLGAALAFESRAFEEGRAYTVEAAPGLRAHGSAEQIKRLTNILVDNALNHSAPGGEIRVTLSCAGEKALLAVYNTGPGVAKEELDRIFERFYRSDAARARQTDGQGGYGLGLAIAKAIAEAHRGSIGVESRAGEWVKFTVKLAVLPEK